MAATSAMAADRNPDTPTPLVKATVNTDKSTTVTTATVCVQGYLFLVATKDGASNTASSGVSVVQMYRQGNHEGQAAQPIKCK